MKTKICLFCGEEFMAIHGNASYCPNKFCAYEAKKLRSVDQYATKSLQADHLWANEKILRENYYENRPPRTEINPSELEAAGFDFDLISKEENIDGTMVFWIRKFGFSFLKNKNIIIWKVK